MCHLFFFFNDTATTEIYTLALHDALPIVEFTKSAKHVSREWPAGYWPAGDAPPDAGAWDKSVAQVKRDLQAMRRLVRDPATDLFARLPHGTGQTVLREALVLADHNAYHRGQLVLIRRLLGAWKTK